MKHIKYFKESLEEYYNIDDIVDTLNDIMLPLKQDGFEIYKTLSEFVITIKVDKKVTGFHTYQKSFKYEDIEDIFNHCISYMEENGYSYIIQAQTNIGRILNLNRDCSGYSLQSFKIEFIKNT